MSVSRAGSALISLTFRSMDTMRLYPDTCRAALRNCLSYGVSWLSVRHERKHIFVSRRGSADIVDTHRSTGLPVSASGSVGRVGLGVERGTAFLLML